MTEQEAEALAKRLERIWGPTKPVTITQLNGRSEGIPDDVEVMIMWRIRADFPHGVWLEAYNSEWEEWPSLRFGSGNWDKNPLEYRTLLSFTDDEDEITIHAKEGQVWLLFFRRGCWLSGLPVEASAHEKAEWVQGFSSEELQAWKLIF